MNSLYFVVKDLFGFELLLEGDPEQLFDNFKKCEMPFGNPKLSMDIVVFKPKSRTFKLNTLYYNQIANKMSHYT